MAYNNIKQQQNRIQFSITSSPVGVYKVSKNDKDPTSVMVSLDVNLEHLCANWQAKKSSD
jgi:hypothetical protein